MRNKQLLLAFGLAAAWAVPFSSSSAQQQGPLTLERAVERALERSPALAAARNELAAAQAGAAQSATWRNPTLNATVEDTRPETRTTTVTLDIPLELGGQRAARIGLAERAQGLAEAELAGVRAEVRARASAAFFAVLLAQQRAELAGGSAALAGRAAEAVDKRVAAGKVSPVEASRASVDLANAELEREEAEAELQQARFALGVALGGGEPVLAEAVPLDAPPQPSGDFAALIDASPALLIGRREAERRRALVDVERGKTWPELTLSVGSKRDAAAGRTQAVIGLSMPLPLFDRNQGAVSEAARRAARAEDDLQAERLRLLGDLQQAASRLAVARASLRTLQATVLPAAQQAFEAATKGYEAGKFAFLDVIDAQRSLLQARTRHLNTLAAAWQAAAAIDRLIGR